MKHVLAAFAALLFIAVYSCRYDTNEIFERNLDREVEPPNIEVVQLDLLPEKDTVILPSKYVNFNFKSSDQKIQGIKYYLDGKLLGSVESGIGSFYLNNEYTQGLHLLKLEIFTHSGTGSIADSMGVEGYVFSTKEWIVKVPEDPYMGLYTTAEDGFLKLKWTKPPEEVTEYIICRESREIGRTTSCEFVDKAYMGEGANYSLECVNASTGLKGLMGQVNLPKEILIKRFDFDTKNNYNIIWDRLKYYAAIDTISVLWDDGYSRTVALDKTSDTSVTGFKIPTSAFGQQKRFWMVLTPKYPDPYFNPSNYSDSFYASPIVKSLIGYPSPNFVSLHRLGSSEFLYYTYLYNNEGSSGADSLFRYSLSENKIIERFRYNPPDEYWSGFHFYNPSVSADGSYYTSHAGMSAENIIIGSGSNINNCKTVDIGYLTQTMHRIPISNNGRGLIIGDKKYLYDFVNQKVLGTVGSKPTLSDFNISSEGNYFFLSVSHTIWFFTYQNDQLEEKIIYADTYPGYHYFDFMATDPDRVVSWNKNSGLFCILKCPDMVIINSFTIAGERILDIDYYNKQILTYSSQLLRVYSLVDGSLLNELPLAYSYIDYNSWFWLAGNSIFHKDGIRYFLK